MMYIMATFRSKPHPVALLASGKDILFFCCYFFFLCVSPTLSLSVSLSWSFSFLSWDKLGQ